MGLVTNALKSCILNVMFKSDKSLLDIWSIPHFLSGIIIGLPALQYGFGFTSALLIVLGLSIFFEIVEEVFHVDESHINKIGDIILGFIAYICGYYFFITFDPYEQNIILIVSCFVYLLVAVPGWIKYIAHRK